MIKLNLVVEEPVFGASTSAIAVVEDGYITQFKDTSSHVTNNPWDGWGDPNKFVGLSEEDLHHLMNCWFWDFSEHIASPKVKITEI